MANVMQSLFNLNMPQQQQAAPAFNPLGTLSAMGAEVGSSLRQNIAGAFGQQTPQQALNSIIQQTQQQADLSTPEGLIQLANNLNQLPQFSGIALAMRQEASKLAQEAGLVKAKTFQATAQGMKALQEKPEPSVKTTADFAEVASELGYGVKPNLADYTAEQTAKVNALLQKRKLEKAEAGAPKPSPTEKAILPGKAKTLETIETGALQAAKTNQTADSIDRVLTNAFTGFGADAKLKASQVAEAFGVTVTGTSETEQLKQLLAQLAQGQAKTLPGALSEKELAFLREAIGTPGFTVQTLRNVVNRLRKDALTSEIENNFVQDFVSGGGDLNKYNFVAKRKEAQAQADQQMLDRDAKIRRLQELRAKKAGGQ